MFARPAGQRHVVTAIADGARITVGGADIELHDVDARLLAHMLGSPPFTLDDLARHAAGLARQGKGIGLPGREIAAQDQAILQALHGEFAARV